LAALSIVVAGMAWGLYWSRYPSVTLTADGQTRRLRSKAKSVRDLLKDEGVTLGAQDFSTPPLTAPLAQQLPIKVTRVRMREKKSVLEVPLSIRWQVRTRQNLRGTLVQKGILSRRHIITRIVLHDQKEVSRTNITIKTEKKPFFTLTLLDEKGKPEKKYDLKSARVYSMLATAYYVGDPMVPSDTTYLGHKLRRGLVAVDPSIIPLRSRLYIPGYGYAYASDTGSAIKGLRIDLAVKDRKEEARYNHREVAVYVLERRKTW
jgi:3D (Asp-Asp-Asp) domain-containing protein